MNRKALLTVLPAASAAAPASPAAGKGKPPTTGAGHKPQVSIVVRGTAARVDPGLSISILTVYYRWLKAFWTRRYRGGRPAWDLNWEAQA